MNFSIASRASAGQFGCWFMPYFIASPSGEMHPFVFEMGASLDWPEVVILAQLGGWVPHKKRPPGKQVMLRSLAQLLNYYATQAVLRRDPETSRRLLEKFPSTGSGQASAQAWNFEFLPDSSYNWIMILRQSCCCVVT